MRYFNFEKLKRCGKSIFAYSVATVMAASQLGVAALASQEQISVTYDAMESYVCVKSDDTVLPGSAVTVNIAESDGNALSDSKLPVISRMFFTGNKGGFDYDIYLPDSFPAGKYDVYVSMSQFDSPFKATLFIFDKDSEETSDALELISDASSASDVRSAIEDNAANLGIDIESVDDIDTISDVIYGVVKSGETLNYEGFNKAFRAGEAAVLLETGTSVDEVMKAYADVYTAEYEDYLDLPNNVKKSFDVLLVKLDKTNGYVYYEDIVKIATVSGCESYGDLKEFILENEDFFGVDTAGKYLELSVNNRSKVFSKMFAERDDFTSAQDVSDSFDRFVKELLKEQENKTDKKPSGGGGGGGGGSLSVGVNADNPFDTDVSPVVTPSALYTDISGHFAESAVNALSQTGIINGFEDGSFRPDDTVTRAQISKMVAIALGIKASGEAKIFDDVNADDWYFEFVNDLSSNGIVSGDGKNFYPNAMVTRQDAAVIICNALKFAGLEIDGDFKFADSDSVADYAADSVSALGAMGYIKGDAVGFRPLSSLTRGEAAVLIERMINGI